MRIAKLLHVAALLATALIAGQSISTPAFADYQADVNDCFSGDDARSADRIKSCTRIIESGKLSQKDLAGAYNWRGEAYRIQNQFDLALADYARSIKINPQSVFPYANRAEVYRVQGKFDLVVADADQAINIDPMLNASYAIRGMAYEKLGDMARARADFNKALSLPVKGNDGPWAQTIARNHLQSIGGGDNGTPNSADRNPGGIMNGTPGQNPPSGTTTGGNVLMNR